MSFKITIVRHSESLPSDVSGARLWRSGLFAKYFFDKGYVVSWLISSYDHYNKKQRQRIDPFPCEPGLHETVKLLKTPGYKKNLSIFRFFDHFWFAIKTFFCLMKSEKPDLIICSYPTPDASLACVIYGSFFKVPVILDIRDQWPDVLFEAFRGKLSYVVRVLLSPYTLMKILSFKYATGLIAANQSFLDWGLGYTGRGQNSYDFVSYIPFEIPVISDKQHDQAWSIYSSLNCNSNDLVITFAGTIGKMFEFESLFSALEMAKKNSINVKVFICGRGSELASLEKKFQVYPNVCFTGQLESQVVFSLLGLSDILLAPYKDLNNFNGHLPNKFMEYCAVGKPILSSLKGLPEELIRNYKFGHSFSDAEGLYRGIEYYNSSIDQLKVHSKNSNDAYKTMFHPSILLPQLESRMVEVVRSKEKQ